MYIYICIYIHIYIQCTYIYNVHIYIQCIYIYIHTYVHMYIYTHMYIYIYTWLHTLHYTTLHCIALHCIALHYITLHTYVYVYTYGLVHLDKIYLTKILDLTHTNWDLTNENGGFPSTTALLRCKWEMYHTGMYPPVIKHGKLGYPL